MEADITNKRYLYRLQLPWLIYSTLFFIFMGITAFSSFITISGFAALAIFFLLRSYFKPKYVELNEHGITFPPFLLNRSAIYIPYNEITQFYAPLFRRYPFVARHKEHYYVRYPNGIRELGYQFMSKADFQEVIEIIKSKISERQNP